MEVVCLEGKAQSTGLPPKCPASDLNWTPPVQLIEGGCEEIATPAIADKRNDGQRAWQPSRLERFPIKRP
ncbi:MAG: hypothetical protein CBD18_06580 [Opitutales bacterium TMED158]|nr:MAG: hypothetical protein CBD18_06580 [Opitutales bacterium TMED158]